jgi:hypothetical protein
MKLRSLTILAAALAALALAGFAAANGSGADAVRILNIESAPVPGSELTAYQVKVAFNLESKPKGKVLLGFDNGGPGSYRMLTEATVARGAGEVELRAEIRQPKRTVLSVYVNLSEDPHPERWTPLAEDTREVSLGK